MLPNANDLLYFLEVATSLNLSRAAERLGLSQPSITLAIKRLEDSVGTPLLHRGKTGVALTEAGKTIQRQARALMDQWDLVREEAINAETEVKGMYTVGCHVSVGIYSLPLLGQLLELYPKLELRLVHDLSRKIAERVIRMEVDIGIVVNPVKHPDLVVKKVCEDEVTFWVGSGKNKVQNLYSGEAVLICDPDLLQTQDLLKKVKKTGIKYDRVLPTSSLELISILTARGAGVGVLPQRVATGPFTKGLESGLSRIKGAPVFKDEISIIYRVENKNVQSIRLLSETILSACK